MKTSAIDKLTVSSINVIIIALPASALSLLFNLDWRLSLVGLFLAYQILVALTPAGRSIGMRMLHIQWNKQYSLARKLLFGLLYSASFSTLVVWIFFPFDLLLINLLLLQFPALRLTGCTLHAYLAGGMYGVKAYHNRG